MQLDQRIYWNALRSPYTIDNDEFWRERHLQQLKFDKYENIFELYLIVRNDFFNSKSLYWESHVLIGNGEGSYFDIDKLPLELDIAARHFAEFSLSDIGEGSFGDVDAQIVNHDSYVARRPLSEKEINIVKQFLYGTN